MKKCIFITLLLLFAVFILTAQSNRHNRNDRNRDREMLAPVKAETMSQPCMRYDCPEFFAASGFARIQVIGIGERDFTVPINQLLGNVRQQLRQKIGGQYRAIVRDYFEQMDIDARSSAASHIVSAGEQIIDRMLNDTEEDCRQFGPICEAGFQNIYIGILMRRSALVDGLLDGFQESSTIPANEREQLRQNHDAFRESAFRVFEQSLQ